MMMKISNNTFIYYTLEIKKKDKEKLYGILLSHNTLKKSPLGKLSGIPLSLNTLKLTPLQDGLLAQTSHGMMSHGMM